MLRQRAGVTRYPWVRAQAGSFRATAGSSRRTDINSKDQYSSATFTAGRTQTKVVCRQKPLLQSRMEWLWQYLKPASAGQSDVMDSLQLLKVLGYLSVPVITLMWWRIVYSDYPERWENSFNGFQNRPSKEVDTMAKQESYFDVIDKLEAKRTEAMVKKGYGGATSGVAPSSS